MVWFISKGIRKGKKFINKLHLPSVCIAMVIQEIYIETINFHAKKMKVVFSIEF